MELIFIFLQLVAGCISQDSDCFLYGAETVYRNFTSTAGNSSTGGPAFSIDSYSMTSIQKCLGLTRNKLIALSLLCGCDYLQHGVAGVGKETALQFLSTLQDDEIFDRYSQHNFLQKSQVWPRFLGSFSWEFTCCLCRKTLEQNLYQINFKKKLPKITEKLKFLKQV